MVGILAVDEADHSAPFSKEATSFISPSLFLSSRRIPQTCSRGSSYVLAGRAQAPSCFPVPSPANIDQVSWVNDGARNGNFDDCKKNHNNPNTAANVLC